ncbi:MAG: putative cysteine desulfurase [Parachlamydiales bacterium]|nr:putative cysteine desulfurase [Parachlamydiales bacterium]
MKQVRDAFPIFRHHPELVYLDSAATAHKPDAVIDALSQFYAKDYATVHRAIYRSSMRATELYHEARETVRRFINADSVDEVVFTRNTTESIHLVSRTFDLKRGDEVLLSELEHHSNLVPWQMLAQEKGIVLKWIKVLDNGALDLSLPFSEKTKLVAITHVSNVTGTVTPIQEIVREARRVGAAVLVDGAQAAPHMSVDVQALDIDFYAFSGHKCYGPTGIGVLYGKRERLMAMPPLQGGGAMVDRVDFEKSTYQEPPLRFEAGTPMVGSAIGLMAALHFLLSVGLNRAAEWEHRLLSIATNRLESIDGCRIIGTAPGKGPIVTFTIDGVHPLDLAAWLDCQNIAIRTGHLCAQPLLRRFGCEAAARASFAVYNTEEDVERFIQAVQKGAGEILISR